MTAPDPAAAPPATNASRRFGFRLPRLTHVILAGWGIVGTPPVVSVDDRAVDVRFGFFHASIALADIERFEIDGPYQWWRAIAVRHTFFKKDISFCTDERGAIVLHLKSQRALYWARHVAQVYLGVEDLQGLADELRRRGIPGEDRRISGTRH